MLYPLALSPSELDHLGRGYSFHRDDPSAFAALGSQFLPLTRLSPEDLTLRSAGMYSLSSGQSVTLTIGNGDQETDEVGGLVLTVTGAARGGRRALVRLDRPQLETGRTIVTILEQLRKSGRAEPPATTFAVREQIQDSERIDFICDVLSRNRCRGIARGLSGPYAMVQLAGLDRSRRRLRWESPGQVLKPPFTVEMFGYKSVYQFQILDGRITGDFLETLLPPEVIRTRRRRTRRAFDESGCQIRFQHPVWPQIQVRRPVRDVSYGGISFWADAIEDILYPGLDIPVVEVLPPGEPPLRLTAQIRVVSAPDRSSPQHASLGQSIGLCVAPIDADSQQRWVSLVGERLHPDTRIGSQYSEQIWEVFLESGFFALSGKTAEDFNLSREAFFQAGVQLDAASARLGGRVVSVSPRGVECSVSTSKAYRHTWLMHQLARRRSDPQLVSRPVLRNVMLRSAEAACVDQDLRWVAAFCEANVRWLDGALLEFARPYQEKGLAFVRQFELMEGSPDLFAPPPPGLTIRAPEPEEMPLLYQGLSEWRPRSYLEAFDLLPETFDLRAVTQLWSTRGMQRARAAWLAFQGETPVAAAIADLAEPGLNLFNILDGVRLVTLGPAAELAPGASEAALAALLRHAAGWYGEFGRDQFVYYREREDEGHTRLAGLTSLGAGYVWVLSAQLLPDWLEHIYEFTTPRGA